MTTKKAAASAPNLERAEAAYISIELTKGYVALIDAADAALVSGKWYAVEDGDRVYAARRKRIGGGNRITQLMHRVIASVDDGSIQVDHRDRDGLNNRRANLRVCNNGQNQANQRKRGASTYKGVRPPRTDHRETRWRAVLAGRSLGYFATATEAALAYNAAATARYGEFALLNEVAR